MLLILVVSRPLFVLEPSVFTPSTYPLDNPINITLQILGGLAPQFNDEFLRIRFFCLVENALHYFGLIVLLNLLECIVPDKHPIQYDEQTKYMHNGARTVSPAGPIIVYDRSVKQLQDRSIFRGIYHRCASQGLSPRPMQLVQAHLEAAIHFEGLIAMCNKPSVPCPHQQYMTAILHHIPRADFSPSRGLQH